MKNFSGKNVIITGAGSGIGRHLAYSFAAHGANVHLTDINETGLSETAHQIIDTGGQCNTYIVDSGSREATKEFANRFKSEVNSLHILINNAGMALGQITFNEVKEEHLERVIDVNMWGVIQSTKEFLPLLLRQQEASLVNISSVFGIIGVQTQVPYCTTKFAVRGFTEALRMEYRNTGLTITTVHPGGIKTNIARNGIHYNNGTQAIEEFDNVARTTPEKAAYTIISGIAKKKERILIGSDAYLIDRLARWMPVAYTSLIKWIHEKKFNR